MPRSVSRRLLTDAALALALLVLTVGPSLVNGLVVHDAGRQKSGDATSFLARTGLPADVSWWVLAGLVVAGLLIRQQNALAALLLAGIGTLGHLLIQTKFQLLDLALPVALYTVAAVARHRRLALLALGLFLVLTYSASLGSRLVEARQEKTAAVVKLDQQKQVAAGQPIKTVSPVNAVSLGIVVDTGQAVLEMWLLLVAAYAVGDGVRSRRAHVAALEQRSADLAREERQRAALAVAAERTRITRELHDVVAHGMSVMVVQAQGAAAALDRHPERAATALRHVIDLGRSSLAEMRGLLAAGRTDPADDPRLAPLPGIGAVPALIDQMRAAGMRIDLRIDGVPEPVPAAIDLSAYRIVQECLTNTLKHAGPDAEAEVLLDFEPACLRVEVADNGTGLAEGADGRGNGLRGVAERVAMLGGVLATGRGERGGFRLGATLPLSVGR
jgi:signal transduction histidine kinase